MSDEDETGGRIRGQRRRRRSPEWQVDAEDEDTFTVDPYERLRARPITSPPDLSSPELVEWANKAKQEEKEMREANFRAFGGPRPRRELDEDELDEDEDRGELLTRFLEEAERNDRYTEDERHDPGMGANREPVWPSPGESMTQSGELIRRWFGDDELLVRWLQKDERHVHWMLEADRIERENGGFSALEMSDEDETDRWYPYSYSEEWGSVVWDADLGKWVPELRPMSDEDETELSPPEGWGSRTANGPYVVELITTDSRAGFNQILETMLNQWAGLGYELHTINVRNDGRSTELFYSNGRGLPLFTYLVIARKKETIADQSD